MPGSLGNIHISIYILYTKIYTKYILYLDRAMHFHNHTILNYDLMVYVKAQCAI